ncbi:hypothetical protein Tco_0652507 [Tanacetum coccineum]|uniref:Uncharacterized protein n=1 Tax=Tanacetum coccineum TaxID=301880 RepID=A0ABQ4WY24_9ASTR
MNRLEGSRAHLLPISTIPPTLSYSPHRSDAPIFQGYHHPCPFSYYFISSLLLPSASVGRSGTPSYLHLGRKRLGIALGPRYEVGESSSAAAARPTGGLRADYGFVATMDREIRALEVEMRDIASSFYHSLHPSGTPPLLPIPLPAPSTSRRADIPEADTPPRKRLLLTTPRPGCEIGESSAAAAARQPGPTIETRLRDTERRMMTALELVNRRVTYQVDVCTRESSEFCTRHHDAQKDRAAVRAEIEVLRRERLAYEQESMETRQALARSEAHCRALEARVTVLETEVHRHEWQRQAADDLAVQHIMRTQALEAGARVDTLEDTGSSS